MDTKETPVSQLASIDESLAKHLPSYSQALFNAKTAKHLTFAEIAQKLGRSEVGIAALFYGQATATDDELAELAQLLGISAGWLRQTVPRFPTRGSAVPMPPTEPLVYRLYEIVQSYGQAIRAVVNEKFGDGIMSAVAFSSAVDKEVDEAGAEWVVITMRGKWLPFSRF